MKCGVMGSVPGEGFGLWKSGHQHSTAQWEVQEKTNLHFHPNVMKIRAGIGYN